MGARSSGLSEERRHEILTATVQTIAERGVDNVRLSDIARSCGLSVGALQHHFATRDQLIDAAFYSYTLGVVREIQQIADAGGDPWSRITRAIRAYRGVGDFRQRSRLWVEFAASAARNPSQRERITAIHAEWAKPLRAAIIDGISSGDFTPVMQVEEIVDSILATMDGYDLSYAAGIIDLAAPGIDVEERLTSIVGAQLGVITQTVR